MKFYDQDQDRMMRFMKPVSIWDAQGNVMYTMRTHKGLGLGYQKDYRSLLDHHMRASAKTFDPAACCEVEIAEDMAAEEVLAAVMGIEAAIIAANDNNNST